MEPKLLTLLAVAAFLALLAAPAAADAVQEVAEVAIEAPVEDLVALASREAAAERRADCLERGFDPQALDCRLCADLSAFLAPVTDGNDAKREAAHAVDADCRACCADFELTAREDAAVRSQYPRAALEVCTRRLERYPKVANFVRTRAPQEHPHLEISYVNGRKPHLVFFDADGVQQEEISIGNWDEDAISEFVGAKLRPEEEVEGSERIEEDAGEEEESVKEEGEEQAEVVEVEVQADASV